MLRTCLSAVLIALVASIASAVEPSLGGIAPYGVQRGVETEVLFQGGRLSDAKELLFYSPGFKVTR